VAQGVGPEFKLQCEKKKKKEREREREKRKSFHLPAKDYR
jgi:hypothetical protein